MNNLIGYVKHAMDDLRYAIKYAEKLQLNNGYTAAMQKALEDLTALLAKLEASSA